MFDKIVIRLARHFLWAGTHFFFGIGEGPSKGEITAANNLQSNASFATETGEGDISTANNFWNAILSGNPADISKVLGPNIAAITGEAQQSIDTTSAFSNRSGGTNAGIQNTQNNTRGSIQNMIDSLTSTAATNVGNMGMNLFNTGTQAEVAQFQEQEALHGQKSGQINDIFNSITSLLSSIPGLGGGGGSSNAAAIDATASGGYGPGNVAVSDAGSAPLNTGFGIYD
jgi:hypothetical protein